MSERSRLLEFGALLSAAAALGATACSSEVVSHPSSDGSKPTLIGNKNPGKAQKEKATDQDSTQSADIYNPDMTQEQIEAEGSEALAKIKYAWNGVIVLHAPEKKNAELLYTESPSSSRMQGATGDLEPGYTTVMVLTQPGLVEWNGRLYFVASEVDGNWGFVDVKYAYEIGAMTVLRYDDENAGPDLLLMDDLLNNPDIINSPTKESLDNSRGDYPLKAMNDLTGVNRPVKIVPPEEVLDATP